MSKLNKVISLSDLSGKSHIQKYNHFLSKSDSGSTKNNVVNETITSWKLNSLMELCKELNNSDDLETSIQKSLLILKEFLFARKIYISLKGKNYIYGLNQGKELHKIRTSLFNFHTLKNKKIETFELNYQGNNLGSLIFFRKNKEEIKSIDKRIINTWCDNIAAKARVAELETLANTDYLTNILVRRAFIEKFENKKSKQGIFVTFDLDHFKSINDKLGHHIGDYVLTQIGSILKSCLRGDDFCARFGGEEFTIYLPQTSLMNANLICNRINTEIAKIKLSNKTKVTASFGLYDCNSESFNDAYAKADKALYEAKSNGRNQVCEYKLT